MMSALESEAGRLLIGLLFTVAVVAVCRYWPSKAARAQREWEKRNVR